MYGPTVVITRRQDDVIVSNDFESRLSTWIVGMSGERESSFLSESFNFSSLLKLLPAIAQVKC